MPTPAICTNRPTLWVTGAENLIAAQTLSHFFRPIPRSDKPSEVAKAGEHHIIAADPDTSELNVITLASALKEIGCNVEVLQEQNTFSNFVFGLGISAASIILTVAKPFKQWQQELGDKPLELSEALNLAKFSLINAHNRTQQNIELETLRQRCGNVSSFDWNRFIKDLEAEIHAAVDRNGRRVKFPTSEPLTIEQVTEKIDELIVKGASGSFLTEKLNQLATDSPYPVSELRKLYSERLGEADLEIDREDNRNEVENLLNISTQSLELADYLPNDLAVAILDWCKWSSILPEAGLLALLTGTSSLHKVGTELVIHRGQNFRVPPTIFSALVAESGQKKSPVFSNFIRQPLTSLRQEKVDSYNAAIADYEAAMEMWQEQKQGKPPSKPKDPDLYYFTNATGEAIPIQASKAPEKALLALSDELSGLLRSENAYRGGRGSDKQDLLSYFDGLGQTVLRVSGIKVDLEKIYLSIFGTIQPSVLRNHMDDCSDPDGQWARFLYVNQPLAAATLPDDDGQAIQIRDRVAEFYRKVDRLPEMEYFLSRDAFKRYQPLYAQLEQLRVTHPKPGMRAVYSKMEGYIGRLAINLHVLWELSSAKECPDAEIPLHILEMAIQLSKFFIGQVKLVHAHSDDENLAPHIVKLIELSKRLNTNGKDGWIKAQQYRETFPGKKRPSAQKARDWMLEAVAIGHGRTRGTGNRLEFHWLRDSDDSKEITLPSPDDLENLGKSGECLGKGVPEVENLINQVVKDDLENLGKSGECLGKGVPEVENLINQVVEDDLGNLGKGGECLGKGVPEVENLINQVVEDDLGNLGKGEPNTTTVVIDEQDVEKLEGKAVLEGGNVPEPFLSVPEFTSDVERIVVSDLGDTFPKCSLSVPEVPEVPIHE